MTDSSSVRDLWVREGKDSANTLWKLAGGDIHEAIEAFNSASGDLKINAIVEFEWDFEEIDTGVTRQTVEVSHEIEITNVMSELSEACNLHNYLQENGLAATRSLVKKAAKKLGLSFYEHKDQHKARCYQAVVLSDYRATLFC